MPEPLQVRTRADFDGDDSRVPCLHLFVSAEVANLPYVQNMSSIRRAYGYWDFVCTIRTKRRWIFEGKAADYLSAIRKASKSRAHVVKPGHYFFRAQLGCKFHRDDENIEWEVPATVARMVPKGKHIKAGGRLNPPGFAYLYLATTAETALAEMRPSLGQSLTVALFKVQRQLRIVVCEPGPRDLPEWLEEKPLTPTEREKRGWNEITWALAHPVNREDQEEAYLPTQILAEAFRAEGFDGVAYRSSLERGTNVVLFNPNDAKVVHRYVYTLRKVRYDFEAAPNLEIRLKNAAGCIEQKTELHTETTKR